MLKATWQYQRTFIETFIEDKFVMTPEQKRSFEIIKTHIDKQFDLMHVWERKTCLPFTIVTIAFFNSYLQKSVCTLKPFLGLSMRFSLPFNAQAWWNFSMYAGMSRRKRQKFQKNIICSTEIHIWWIIVEKDIYFRITFHLALLLCSRFIVMEIKLQYELALDM